MKVNFIVKYSQEKDINIYLNALWKSTWTDYGTSKLETAKKYLPIEFLDQLKDTKDRESAKEIVKNYLLSINSKNFDKGTELICKWFIRFLNEEEDQIIGRLEKIYSKKFPFETITVYLTTFFSNPYNYEQKWYMVGRNYNFWGLLGTSTHELNHFMFYYYYQEKLKTLCSNTAFEYLKEAFAILSSNNPDKENQDKPNVLSIQKFVFENNDKSTDEIIDLVIKNKLLENIQ